MLLINDGASAGQRRAGVRTLRLILCGFILREGRERRRTGCGYCIIDGWRWEGCARLFLDVWEVMREEDMKEGVDEGSRLLFVWARGR
jgi:hypothetical protein